MKYRNGKLIVRPVSANCRSVALPDIHGPKADPDALRWAIKEVIKAKPQVVHILGDLGDFEALSRFPKSPEQQLGHEEEMAFNRKLVQRLDRAFRGRRVIFYLGNHEDRVKKYIWKGAPALAATPELNVAAMMGVPARWEVVPYKYYRIDQDVLIQHGVRWGKNTCQTNLGDFGHLSSLQGHSHRLNLMTRRLPNGKVQAAAESGCLCRLEADYAPLNNWRHGITLIHAGKLEIVQR